LRSNYFIKKDKLFKNFLALFSIFVALLSEGKQNGSSGGKVRARPGCEVPLPAVTRIRGEPRSCVDAAVPNFKSEEKNMKNYSKKQIGILLTMVALFMASAMQTGVLAQEKPAGLANDQSADRLVGAWETTVTPVNCNTGQQVGPPFHGVITFNEGGTVAEFGANPAVPYRTPGHGIWSSDRGSGGYTFKFSFIPLTPAGVPVGRMRVSQVGELPRFSDVSTSYGSFVLSDFAGNTLATGCTTAVAVRLS
jgi:hypothetical protein